MRAEEKFKEIMRSVKVGSFVTYRKNWLSEKIYTGKVIEIFKNCNPVSGHESCKYCVGLIKLDKNYSVFNGGCFKKAKSWEIAIVQVLGDFIEEEEMML